MSTNDSVSKSRRLKKYQKVYTEYLQQQKVPKEKVPKELNAYQKFFQSESKKEKYKGLDTKTRMARISEVWKTVKKTDL